MFNKLFQSLGHIGHFSSVVGTIEDLLAHFESEYFKDKDAKNAAIDAVIEVLQAHKDK